MISANAKCAQIEKYIYSTKAIGKGSFSKVYKGLDTSTDQVIAIKVIEKMLLKQDLVERLKNEVLLMTSLQHAHIVDVRAFLEDEDNFYLILEYCAGGDLAHLIKKGRIQEDRARDYMQQLASALRYLKSKNIIHRDLKPQNILLSADEKIIKVTDFNFARELYDYDLAQTLCGSPLYMAPEIIRKHEYTVKSDLWSVGLILYEMVYGNNPYFDAYNTIDLIDKIESRAIQYTNRVSADCNSLLNGLLQKNAENRFTWPEFFSHKWLEIDEPVYLPTEPSNMWESVSLSTIANANANAIANVVHRPISQPMKIISHFNAGASNFNRFKINVVDDYVPFGISPPKFTQSEPVEIYRMHAPKDHVDRRNSITASFQPSSAPENRTVTDHIWSYMTSSVGILKGAVDYITSATSSTSSK